MRNIKPISICLLLILILFNCNNESVFQDPNIPDPVVDDGPRTYADVQEDFDNFEFTTGVNDVTLINIDGDEWSFRVIMPDVDFTNNDRPLVISMHGCASCGIQPTAHQSTACLAEPGFEAIAPIIISPNSNGKLWPTVENNDQVLTLIDLAIDYLPVDSEKIVAHGYSDGGNGSWFFAETQSSLFSAAIPMASHWNTTNSGVGRLIPIPIYVVHGENDATFPVQEVQGWVDASVTSGSDITFVIAPGLTHTEPCNYVDYLKVAADWLVNSVWN
ncbi:dienelactone hydrolase family protein [Yeosuana sp. MJ-SS3]|uniref:Dienelactone hydrolase family protein n=1 Tax=Gilvirhabdus luticola TaxID=3079858 RepID=A0ABU3U545_9FLAO|nr:dienelactone hydrolase family protein [Yeosuana sp. MJ-SS3]MDU8885532.1 dienelactone hydrolase family protein [Yeosuana sp. MJ-SS3]